MTAALYNAIALKSMTYSSGLVTTSDYYGIEHDSGSATNFGRLYESKAAIGGNTRMGLHPQLGQ